jgi:hypothetical protein
MINFFITDSLKGLSFTFYLKLTLILILFLITIYLLYIEYYLIQAEDKNYYSSHNRGDFYENKNYINKLIRDILFKYVPGGLAYYTFWHNLEEKNKNDKSTRPLLEEKRSPEEPSQKNNLWTNKLLQNLKDNEIFVIIRDKTIGNNITKDIHNSPLSDSVKRSGKIFAEDKAASMCENIKNILLFQKKRNETANTIQEIIDLKIKKAEGKKWSLDDNIKIEQEKAYRELLKTQDEVLIRDVKKFNSELNPELKSTLLDPNSNSKTFAPSTSEYSEGSEGKRMNTNNNLENLDIKKSGIFILDFNVIISYLFTITLYDLAKIWLVGNIYALLYSIFSLIIYKYYCKKIDKEGKGAIVRSDVAPNWPTFISKWLNRLYLLSDTPRDFRKRWINTYWMNIFFYCTSVSILVYYIIQH